MLKHTMNLLKGEVTARVESGFPERVLNLCGEYGLLGSPVGVGGIFYLYPDPPGLETAAPAYG